MAQAIPWLIAGGTALSAVGSYQQGKAAQNASRYEAAQYQDAANLKAIEGQNQAAEIRRQKEVALSDARAAAAASGGGGVGESQFLMQQGRLGGALERNALSTIYQANVEAGGLRRRATGALYEGKVAKQAGTMKALVTAISGGVKAYDAYST